MTENSAEARAERVKQQQEADARLPLNRRMRAQLAYYADPYGPGKKAAVRQYRGHMVQTDAALRRRGLTCSIDVFPYTALTPAGVEALKQPRQDVPE